MADNSERNYVTDYTVMNDEQLVQAAQSNDMRAMNEIMMRYHDFVAKKIKAYFLVGADRDDIFQEGMIGLYKAVRDFDVQRSPSFMGFANICISRQIITAIKAANRQKHIPLNNYVPLEKSAYDEGGEETYIEVISEQYPSDPEAIVIDKENRDTIECKISEALSKLELQVLIYYLRGNSYQEISELIKKDVKSVDNAIQRIKRKLEAILKN